MSEAALPPPRRHGRLVVRLLLLAAVFFGFGFALVPLYDTLCAAIGFNGKTLKDAIAAKDLPPSVVNYQRKLGFFIAHAVMAANILSQLRATKGLFSGINLLAIAHYRQVHDV